VNVTLRRGKPEDTERCGAIAFEAFKHIAEAHNFPGDFPSAEAAQGLLSWLLAQPGFYSVVAEVDGRIIGSNFLDERNPIAGVGPITVDATVQNRAVGKRLMDAVHERAAERGFPGVRLVQAAYHMRSLTLYTKLGYDAREPLVCMQGKALQLTVPDLPVRQATEADLPECNALCRRIHGHDRGGELRAAVDHGTARVVEHQGRITGYATVIAFFGHAVGETNRELQALIGSATEFGGPGFLVPMRNAELLRWCLQQGLRAVQPMTLMSRGLYNEPAGAFLPSVLY
jgi:GNAT superfamily N-acetyltransferase